MTFASTIFFKIDFCPIVEKNRVFEPLLVLISSDILISLDIY